MSPVNTKGTARAKRPHEPCPDGTSRPAAVPRACDLYGVRCTYDDVPVATPADAPQTPVDASPELTLRRLEDHLWAAADLFRNKVSNQKDYILALLFFKRASNI